MDDELDDVTKAPEQDEQEGEGSSQEPVEQGLDAASEQEDGAVEGEEGQASEQTDEQDDDGALTVSLGGEDDAQDGDGSDPRAAAKWIRDLRKSDREKTRIIREQEAEIARLRPDPAVVIGPEPNPDDYEIWEEAGKAKFRSDYAAWAERKQKVADQQKAKQQAEEQDRQRWQTRVESVNKAAATLKVTDHEEAVQAFEDTFSPLQQAIVLDGPQDAKSSALLRYALAKNPSKAAELAAITNPVKFAFAVSKLEANMKVTPRKTAPPPDRQVRSSVSGAAAVDNQKQRLLEEAGRTGDYSKVADFNRAQIAKARAAK